MDLIANLRNSGLKVTPQRLAIYGYLAAADFHPTAEKIYGDLKDSYPNMSLATVYKTLSALREAGLAVELNVGEDKFRYDACTEPHAHLICSGCHRVTDFFGEPINQEALRQAEQETGFSIESERVYFYGLCGDCK